MISGPGQAAASHCRRRDPAGLLTLLAAFFVLFQLPGPATCSKLNWRFTAVALEVTESEEPPGDESTAEPEAVAVLRGVDPESSGQSVRVEVVIPVSRLQPVLDAGTTRAPPTA